MKLLTHNLLMCHKKGCTVNNFPLRLVVEAFNDVNEDETTPCNAQYMERMVEKLDYNAFRGTVSTLDWNIELPEEFDTTNEQHVKDLHFLLCRRQIITGKM